MSDPSFVAASDQMRSTMREVAKMANELQPSLRAAGLTRRQTRRIIEKWVTRLLAAGTQGEA